MKRASDLGERWSPKSSPRAQATGSRTPGAEWPMERASAEEGAEDEVNKSAGGSVLKSSSAATGQGSGSKFGDPSAVPWLAPPGSTAQAASLPSRRLPGHARRRCSRAEDGSRRGLQRIAQEQVRQAAAMGASGQSGCAQGVLPRHVQGSGPSRRRPVVHQLWVSALVRICEAPGAGPAEGRRGRARFRRTS